MQQVFYNIVKNSIEAGSSIITINIGTIDDIVTLSFMDNGKGIKNSDLTKMFTPFFTTKKNGTGLGLPICKKIVEEHGANIQITSLPNKYTENRINIKKHFDPHMAMANLEE